MKNLLIIIASFSLLLTAPPASANRNYQLKIVYQESASSIPVTWNLTCRPAGGNHPLPKLACNEIRTAINPFQRPPKNEACTMIYGGDQVTIVTGIWAGKTIKRKFTRSDGCEIARWQQLEFTLSGKRSD